MSCFSPDYKAQNIFFKRIVILKNEGILQKITEIKMSEIFLFVLTNVLSYEDNFNPF